MKKATEILQEIQEQNKFLIKLVNNQDQILKLILNKLTSNSNVPSSDNFNFTTEPISKATETKKLEGNDAIALKIKHAEQQNKNSVFEKILSESELEEVEPQFSTRSKRGDRVNTDNISISVSQQLIDEKNSPIALATVKIMDSTGSVIKSSRSNIQGKWIAVLKPGNYTVHVLKKSVIDKSQKTIEEKYNVEIVNSTGSVLELERKIL